MNFFAELKRRNVIRMAGLYLVGAWLLIKLRARCYRCLTLRLGAPRIHYARARLYPRGDL